MSEILNLRRFRKARARSEAAVAADRNRVAFGRTRAERGQSEAEAARGARFLDGRRLEPGPEKADRGGSAPAADE